MTEVVEVDFLLLKFFRDWPYHRLKGIRNILATFDQDLIVNMAFLLFLQADQFLVKVVGLYLIIFEAFTLGGMPLGRVTSGETEFLTSSLDKSI